MGASPYRKAAWDHSWPRGLAERVGAGSFRERTLGRAGPGAEGEIGRWGRGDNGGVEEGQELLWGWRHPGLSLWKELGRCGRTWSSYNPDQKVKTSLEREKDVAWQPRHSGEYWRWSLDPGAGDCCQTLCQLRSPQASCLFVLTMGSMFSAAPVVQICQDTTWFCNR